MNDISLERLLDIGIALSKERDGDSLLELILTTAMDITACDGGTLYILNDDYLTFKLMITKSMGIHKGGRYGSISLPPVPMARESACARSALEHAMFNVPDGQNCERLKFTGPKLYDAITGYTTVSMMVAPMEDDKGRVIGVLQLLNAQSGTGEIIPFDRAYEQVISALASQAAILLTNMNYAAAVQGLMDSFVRVMSTAIDSRTPYNVNHTRGMVRVGERFIDWLGEQDSDWRFDGEKKHLFLMSVWLHDIGKLTIPLEVMNKASRLGARTELVESRFHIISLLDQVALLEGRITAEEYRQRKENLDQVSHLVASANRGYSLPPELVEQIKLLGVLTYADPANGMQPWLTEEELRTLTIARGTLTPEERAIMEGHVTMTRRLLDEMNFPVEYACVPEWAGGHHEFLNGTGYPRKLSGDQIPLETRLLTILDIFDALTQDRPYSTPQPVDQALRILGEMAQQGQLDSHILSLFCKSHAWEVLS